MWASKQVGRCSAAGLSRQVFGVPISFYRDLGESLPNLLKITRCKLNIQRTEVIIQALELTAARDGHNPRLLSQQPRGCNLRQRCLLPVRDTGRH